MIEGRIGPCFVPRFPFHRMAVSYSLLVESFGGTELAEAWKIVRGDPRSAISHLRGKSLAIYPSAAELPVNLLQDLRAFF